MSSTCSKNRSGPNTDPWGTPQVRFPGSQNFFISINFKVFPEKFDPNYEITFLENPVHPIFLRSIS